jgi:hypothetical protein
MRVFCGRRKTDLTPTVPIKRDVFDMSASMMSRSTSRGSGRVYSSMTRLDRSRSPGGGNLLLSQHQHHPAQRPSRSKSTTHLSSTGLKLTRTEMLRQALVAKKETGGKQSSKSSRPCDLNCSCNIINHGLLLVKAYSNRRYLRLPLPRHRNSICKAHKTHEDCLLSPFFFITDYI